MDSSLIDVDTLNLAYEYVIYRLFEMFVKDNCIMIENWMKIRSVADKKYMLAGSARYRD